MHAETFALTQADLLAHREFVLRLARRLVGDSAADDVAQETWLVALRRRWSDPAAARGWLARVVRSQARQHVRSTQRRSARETNAARSELDDGDEALRERLMLQQSVAAAVLALSEPHRAVVILRHYEGLSTAQIAARRSAPEGTIRAQLSRAYGELRATLDRRHGREAWSVALIGWLSREGKHTATASAASVAVWIAAASVAALSAVWLVRTREDGASERRTAVVPLPSVAPPEPAAQEPERVATPSPAEPQRTTVPADSLDDLLARAHELEAAIRLQLLTPAPELEARFATQLTDANWDLARLIDAKHLYPGNDLAGLGADGTYYSFATRSHDLYEQADLRLEADRLVSSGSGDIGSYLIDLGDMPLEHVERTAPSFLDDQQREAWEWCWTAQLQMRGTAEEMRQIRKARMKAPRRNGLLDQPQAMLDHAYLLRSAVDGGHDHLIAFRVVAGDEWGYTLLWRQLMTWELANPHPWVRPAWAGDPTPAVTIPPQLRDRPIAALLDARGELRDRATAIALAVPDELLASDPSSRFVRLMHGNQYETLVAKLGGGFDFSFTTGEYGWRAQPTVRYEAGQLEFICSGGQTGAALDVGDLALDAVHFDPPPTLGEQIADAWRFLWDAEFAGAKPDDADRYVEQRSKEL